MYTFLLLSSVFLVQDEFSGPQKGEALPDCQLKVIYGPDQGKSIQLARQVEKNASLVIFVHEVTRPAIGLVRTVTSYANKRKSDGLVAQVIFLTSDPTETENWMKRAQRALPQKINVCISLDGIEGPGAFGLNRKMQVTGLVTQQGKVTHNFALIQPSLQVDAQKICNALATVLGDKKMPTLADIGIQGRGRGMNGNGKYEKLMRPFIQKTASNQDVMERAQMIEKEASADPAFKKRVFDVANRIINAGKLENYGTAKAQEFLKKWAKEFGKSGSGSQ